MVRREQINDDDHFGFVLDTFSDRKTALFFYTNPLGVQQDGIWNDFREPDYSYDMLWNSQGRITPQGFVVWFEIPFRSLRFPRNPEQTWGLFFERDIRRNLEFSFYPHISNNTQGWLTQETHADGLRDISPGRNMQFVPYGSLRSFRGLDDRPGGVPHFFGKSFEPRAGLDSKIVLKDSLVFDATVNPDFAQVESDEPQITVNQRFEVFFPEKRPFFLENSGYFGTPINLVFTRRIADPDYGLRLTSKQGPWSIGAFFADDKSPGDSLAPADPLSGAKAYFGVLRVNHDIGKQSTIGLIYTDRELATVPNTACTDNRCIVGSNRVGGLDAKITFSPTWYATAQALVSSTDFNNGFHKGGPTFGNTSSTARARSNTTCCTRTLQRVSRPRPVSFAAPTFAVSASSPSTAFVPKASISSGMVRASSPSTTGTTRARVSNGLPIPITVSSFSARPFSGSSAISATSAFAPPTSALFLIIATTLTVIPASSFNPLFSSRPP